MQAAKYRGEPKYTEVREKTKDGWRIVWRDNRERIRFDQSKYIPGNGAHYRLGR